MKVTDYPKVSIIVLNWNGLEDTLECLESLKKITYPNYEVIVVDNASQGDDVKIIREKFGAYIHIIENDKNYGYTGGNNIGIRYGLAHSQPDYLLILNNDVVVVPEFLTCLVEVAEADASVGIVGPKVYYHDSPNRIQSAGANINMWTGGVSIIGVKQIDAGQFDESQEMDYVPGCCLLVKHEVVQKIGLFDESYFCYWDETDYCTRARRAGYKIVYTPKTSVWHRKELKQRLWAKLPGEEKASALAYYFWARNMFRFMRKHASKWQYCSFLFCFLAYRFWLTTAVCLLYHRSMGQAMALCRGTRDGILDSDVSARLYRKN